MRQTLYGFGILGLVVLTAGSLSVSAQGRARGRGPTFIPMSGTYELDVTRGDNAQRAAELATRNLPQWQRDRAYQNLLGRLQAPATIAIDRQGRSVTISSSNGPRASFDADGQQRNESWPGGRMTTTHAEFIGSRLSVSTTGGNRNTDFLVTFEPQNNGTNLLVTRRFDSDDIGQPVTVRNYYRRVAVQPRWDVYAPAPAQAPPGYNRRPGPRPFTVPEGTRFSAVLETSLSTRTSRSGERFSMTVDGPAEYRGAQIEGVVYRSTPYGQGHNAEMRVDFDTIRLRNGETAEFDAVLNTVRTPGNRTFRVDSSGASESNRDSTIQNGAIGAAIGAIIGAVAGGGKGAVIGAVVGGAGGAILAQDREEHLDLPPGTEVTLTVTPPRYRTP